MTFGAYLTGPFGQSQALYEARNEAKRQRGTEATVRQQISQDTQTVLERQANLDYVIDPSFNQHDLFQPLTTRVTGITTKRQENWFDNNVFYHVPVITPNLGVCRGFFHQPTHGKAMAILPSPYTIVMMSDLQGYADKLSAIRDIAEIIQNEAILLAERGVSRIQYDEPWFVYKNSLNALEGEDYKLLNTAMDWCGSIPNASTSLHTYFGDAEGLLDYFQDLDVDCVGIDLTETRPAAFCKPWNKELALGMIDVRTTAREDPELIARTTQEIQQRTGAVKVWITPNTGTEYIGYTAAIEVVDLLGRIKQVLS